MGGNGFGNRAHLGFIHQDAHRRGAGVFVLTVADGPEKRPQKRRRKQQAQGNEYENDGHESYWAKAPEAVPSPSWLPSQVVTPLENAITVMELSGIRMAQTTGDRLPLAAMPIPTML